MFKQSLVLSLPVTFVAAAVSAYSQETQNQNCKHIASYSFRTISFIVEVAPEHHSSDDQPNQVKQAVQHDHNQSTHKHHDRTLDTTTGNNCNQQEQPKNSDPRIAINFKPSFKSKRDSLNRIESAARINTSIYKINHNKGYINTGQNRKNDPEIGRTSFTHLISSKFQYIYVISKQNQQNSSNPPFLRVIIRRGEFFKDWSCCRKVMWEEFGLRDFGACALKELALLI